MPLKATLTPTEFKVLHLLAQGYTHQTIAEKINYQSVGGVHHLLDKAFKKLGIDRATFPENGVVPGIAAAVLFHREFPDTELYCD